MISDVKLIAFNHPILLQILGFSYKNNFMSQNRTKGIILVLKQQSNTEKLKIYIKNQTL